MDWQDCNYRKFVKETGLDTNLVKALIESSKKKLGSHNRLELDEITSSTKISLVYDSLRELLEALAIKKGFKIYNHECFCSFLKEVCGQEKLSKEFDKFRRLRNQLNYYGKDVSLEEAKFFIKDILVLRNKILGLVLK